MSHLEFHRAQFLGPFSLFFMRMPCKIGYKMAPLALNTLTTQRCYLNVCVEKMKKNLSSVKLGEADSNLLLNETKTKHMVISTKQMSKVRNLDEYTPPLTVKDKTVDRVKKFKLLGTWLSENLKWTEHVNEVTSDFIQCPTRKC